MHWEDEKVRPGGVVGTIMYMAPERFIGQAADARSDIFSLGLTLYFLVTGQLPFVRCKANEVIAGLARLRPPHAYIDDFPDRIRRVMEKMLAREPAARYPTAAALIKDLEALWSKKGPAAPPCGRLWLWDEDPSEMGAVETMSHWSRPPSHSESLGSDLRPSPRVSDKSSHYKSEVVAALDEWDMLPEAVAAEGSSDEIARLIDAAWDDDAPRAWGSAVKKDQLESERARPQKLMTDSWRIDLRQALNSIETAGLAEHQRNRLSRDPGQAEVNALLKRGPARGATRRLKRPDLKGAIKKLSRSIDDHGGHPQPWTKRGIARARGGDLEGAVEDYSRALALDATYLPALANRASANFHLRRYALCEEDCTRAIARAPRLAKAWLFRGISRAMLGRGGAREDMLRFLKLSPYSPYVRYIRSLLRQVEGR
jgi:regulator of sirC expression with transglutaminase-like and TPR domain